MATFFVFLCLHPIRTASIMPFTDVFQLAASTSFAWVGFTMKHFAQAVDKIADGAQEDDGDDEILHGHQPMIL